MDDMAVSYRVCIAADDDSDSACKMEMVPLPSGD